MQFSTAFIAAAAAFFGAVEAAPQVGAPAVPPMPMGIQIKSANKELDGKFITTRHSGAGQQLAVVGGTTKDGLFTYTVEKTDVSAQEKTIGKLTYTIKVNNPGNGDGQAYLQGGFTAAAKPNAGGIPVLFGAQKPSTWGMTRDGSIIINKEAKWVVCDASTMTNAPGMTGMKVLGWKQHAGSDRDGTCSDVTLHKA